MDIINAALAQVSAHPSLTLCTGFAILYAAYYLLVVVQKPKIACGDPKFRQFLHRHCPISNEKFWPTWWCFESRAQTILRALIQSSPPADYSEEYLKTPDGGEIKLDWVENDQSPHAKDTRPTVLMMPGLTGSSKENYILHMVHDATELGYRSVVFNNRGTGDTSLKTPRTYCAANTEDLELVVDHVKTKYPDAPLMGVGVSLGGLILFNYVAKKGEQGCFITIMVCSPPYDIFESTKTLEQTVNYWTFNRRLAKNLCGIFENMILFNYMAMLGERARLKAAMCISVGWDVFASVDSLDKAINYFLFNKTLAKSLRYLVEKNLHLFEQHLDIDAAHVLRSESIKDFDERFTAKVFGYDSVDHYYTDASLHTKVHALAKPVLCLSAADDPFSPDYSIPCKDAEENDNIAIVKTAHGGHIGFLEGTFPRDRSYLYRWFRQYVKATFEHGIKED